MNTTNTLNPKNKRAKGLVRLIIYTGEILSLEHSSLPKYFPAIVRCIRMYFQFNVMTLEYSRHFFMCRFYAWILTQIWNNWQNIFILQLYKISINNNRWHLRLQKFWRHGSHFLLWSQLLKRFLQLKLQNCKAKISNWLMLVYRKKYA